MTPLNNSKGVALVVLVIAMTLIAVLATSLVSIVADKNKSMIYAYDGFHASIIADSGAAFAIRYISEGLSDTSKPYFYEDLKNNDGSISWKYYSSVYKLDGVADPIGKFKVTRRFRTTIGNDNVVVESDYNHSMATRKVKISYFRRFLNPITFYPDYDKRPYRYDAVDSRKIVMPVIGNHDYNLTVSQIDLTMPTAVYLQSISVAGSNIFNYITDTEPGLPSCPEAPATPTALCVDSAKGVWLPASTSSFPTTNHLKLHSHTITANAQNDYVFQFASTAPGSTSQYAVKLYSKSTMYPQAYSWGSNLIFKPKATTP